MSIPTAAEVVGRKVEAETGRNKAEIITGRQSQLPIGVIQRVIVRAGVLVINAGNVCAQAGKIMGQAKDVIDLDVGIGEV